MSTYINISQKNKVKYNLAKLTEQNIKKNKKNN